jgi:hypothetical protein
MLLSPMSVVEGNCCPTSLILKIHDDCKSNELKVSEKPIITCRSVARTTLNYLMPVIQHTWSLLQAKLLDKINSTNRTLQLAGDGRCDSPGFSAKYCTCSLLDMES